MSKTISDLDDLSLECIFKNLPKRGRDCKLIEPVCQRWRQISLSLWRRLQLVDSDELDCFLSTLKISEFFHAHSLQNQLLKSAQIANALLSRIDVNNILRICFKHVIIEYDLLKELLARCQNLQELFLYDVDVFSRNLKDLGITKRSDNSRHRLSHISISAVNGLQTFVWINVRYCLSEWPTTSNSLVAFGIGRRFLSIDLQSLAPDADSLNRFILQLKNNALTLKALHFFRIQLSLFAEQQCVALIALQAVKWLRLDWPILRQHQQLWSILGILPNLEHLLLSLVTVLPSHCWNTLGESRQIFQLKTLAIVFGPGTSTDELIRSLVNIIKRRHSNLAQMQLICYDFAKNASKTVPQIVQSRLDNRLKEANVQFMWIVWHKWPIIDGLNLNSL